MPILRRYIFAPVRRVLSWLTAFLIFAQMPGIVLAADDPAHRVNDDYLIDVWNSERGLPENSVVSLAQTPEGYLWLGTLQAGVTRFDGVRFVPFDPANTLGLPRFDIQRLMVDSSGALWVAMVGGSLAHYGAGRFTLESTLSLSGKDAVLSLVYSRTNEVIFLTKLGELVHGVRQPGTNSSWEIIQLPDNAMPARYSASSDGRIWYRRSDQRLGCWQNGKVEPLHFYAGLRGEQVRALTTDAEGRVWVGTERGLACFKDGGFVEMTPTNGEPDVAVQDFVFAGDGRLWVRTEGRLRKCSGRQWIAEAENWSKVPIPGNPALADLHGDQDGGVWFRHRHLGVWHVQPNGDGQMEHLDDHNGLPNGLIDCWLQDREGNIWLGFEGGGLVRLRPRHFNILRRPDSTTGAVVRSVCEDANGDIWLGGADGKIFRWHQELFNEVVVPKTQLPVRDVTVWPNGPDGLWVGTVQNGVWILNAGTLQQPFPAKAVGTVVRVLFKDSQGRVWFGNEFGLYCWSNGKMDHFTQAQGFRDGEYVLAMVEDTERSLWIGTADGHLWRLKSGQFTLFTLPASSPAFRFWSLLTDDDGTVWVGTLGGGLLRWRDGQLTRCTSADGLPSDTISQLLEDGRGNLWAGSRAGIFSVKQKVLNDFLDGRDNRIFCSSFGTADGLPTLECSAAFQPACWHGRDGRLWFATVKGAVFVQPDELPANLLPPTVVIEEVRVDGISQSIPSEKPALILSPGRHNVAFRFTGLSLTAPEGVRFQWRLKGLEQPWVDGGNQRAVGYNFLPSGQYSFEVRACNSDGIWSHPDAAVALHVLPYFWETWWFRVLAPIFSFALIGGAILLVIRRRHRQRLERLERLHALERERMRIARDIHDQVGANLTKIGKLTEFLDRESAVVKLHQPVLQTVTDTTRKIVQIMDEIVWAVNPRNDTLDNVVNYLVHYTEEFLGHCDVGCELDVPFEFPSTRVSAEVRHNLFIAMQEALNNAVKYARPTRIRLKLVLQAKRLSLSLEDDGHGFDADAKSALGNGLENMRHRIESVGGKFQLISAPGEGTIVHFELPVGDA